MEDYVLPQDLAAGTSTGDVFILPYSSDKASSKARIVLDCHVFSFLTVGVKTVSYASGTQSITPRHFFFLPAGNCLMSEKMADNGLYESMLMFVSKKALNAFFAKNPPYPSVAAKTMHVLDLKPIVIDKDDFINNLVHGLRLLSAKNSSQNATLNMLKLEELMCYLLERDPGLINYFKSLCDEWDEDAQLRKTVNIHMHNSVTVEELAFLCNMSLSTFKRKFTKVFNDSPKQWFLKMRMQKAASLLKTKGQTASELYNELGYENLSSFIQAFKQFHGITPKQFQQQD